MGKLSWLGEAGILRAREDQYATGVPPTAAPVTERTGQVGVDGDAHWVALLRSVVWSLAANLVSLRAFLVRHVDYP